MEDHTTTLIAQSLFLSHTHIYVYTCIQTNTRICLNDSASNEAFSRRRACTPHATLSRLFSTHPTGKNGGHIKEKTPDLPAQPSLFSVPHIFFSHPLSLSMLLRIRSLCLYFPAPPGIFLPLLLLFLSLFSLLLSHPPFVPSLPPIPSLFPVLHFDGILPLFSFGSSSSSLHSVES